MPTPLPECLRSLWSVRAQPAAVQAGAVAIDKREAARVKGALWTLDDYDQWIRAGMALHATGWGAAAYAIWCEWASQSEKFDAALSRRKWDSFHADRQAGVTLGTIFWEAKARGWVDLAALSAATGVELSEPPTDGAPAPLPRRAPRVLNFAFLGSRRAPARPWVRTGWLGYELTLLSGRGGTGKSGLTQHEATAGVLGRAYFAPECEPYTSLVWNCEDEHDDLWRRQERICEHEGIDMADLAGKLHLVSRYGCDNALMAEGAYGVLSTTRLLEELRQ